MTAIAAVSMLSCSKNEVPSPVQDSTVISAVIPDTKVSFQALTDGKFPLKWSPTGEEIRVYCRANDAWSSSKSSSYTLDESGKKASFTIDLPAVESGTRDYYVTSPSSTGLQILAANASDYLDKIRLDCRLSPQVPNPNSPDSRTILLVSKHEGYTETPSKIDVDFSVLQAFGRMTVKGLDAASVSNIRIIFPDRTHVNGFLDYKISTDECILTKASASTNYIDINPKNLTINSTSFDVWFGLVPNVFAAGENIKFVFTTPDGDISKETKVPAGKSLSFTRGKATGFSVDMSGAGKKESLVLTFDCSVNSASLETNYWNGRGSKTITLPADDGKSYSFLRGGGLFYNATTKLLTLHEDAGYSNGYLGLPAIEGYKLVSIEADRTNNTGADVSLEITTAFPKTAESQSITGSITWAKGKAKPAAITLSGTSANTMYYMHSLNNSWVPFNELKLTYETE